jgi:hypothetical protein
MYKIENWCVVGKRTNPYHSPQQVTALQICGQVFGHPKWEDGHSIITSTVMHVDGRKVFTRNNKYILGTVKPEYREWYENFEGKPFNEDDHFNVS